MIYLDNAATTACDPRVVDAMLPFFTEDFANASSIDHGPGNIARKSVDSARESVAALVNARPEDVVFTSGSTEANNIALTVPCPVLTTPVEHPSVLDPFTSREKQHDHVLNIDEFGRVDLQSLADRLGTLQSKSMLAVILTNNETGVEQDVAQIASLALGANALLHFDATQAVSTCSIDVKALNVAGLAISAHKIYGPKGVGALIASSPLRRLMRPVLRGGGHERGLRSGTLNVPAIVGFGVAARLAYESRASRRAKLSDLRTQFLRGLRQAVPSDIVEENFPEQYTSPHILSMRINGVSGRALLRSLRDDVAFSLGSACATNKAEPSHVLTALGFDKKRISETVRLSFSPYQSVSEIECAANLMAKAICSLQRYSLTA